ncbi:hypothetical protein ACFQY0_19025 [Haloferula chungangensis]|uniref:Uncharacterized protein n=1 Tax=Haloferula chungangensis TaxID=1048331 RepID=A0ABW2LBW8_9BACT
MLRTILASALLTTGVASSSNASELSKRLTFTVAAGTATEVGLIRPIASPEGTVDGVTAIRSYSGNFSADLVFDTNTLAPKNFTFNSGSIIGSGYSLQLFSNVVYAAPYGIKSTFYFQQAGQISYSPTTMLPPGLVDGSGALIPSQQNFLASQGIIVTGRSVTGTALNRITDDYINFPDTLPLPGSATVTISQVSKNTFSRTLKAKLVLSLNEAETILLPAPSLNTSIIKTEAGTITSSSSNFTAPTPYGQWAIDNQLNNPDPESPNPSGIPYAILMALDLPATASTLPITIENTGYGPVATIVLPEDGLQNPMSIEYTSDLSASNWVPLTTNYYLHGPSALDQGKSGSPKFTLPPGPTGFIRFVSIIE